MFGLLGRLQTSLVFLKSNFKFRHMFCRNKKFCSVKIKSCFPVHFTVIQLLNNIGSLPFISWAISFHIIIFSCRSTDVPRFVEKYKTNKKGHFWQARLGQIKKIFQAKDEHELSKTPGRDHHARWQTGYCRFSACVTFRMHAQNLGHARRQI
jgi:hypothetical protein